MIRRFIGFQLHLIFALCTFWQSSVYADSPEQKLQEWHRWSCSQLLDFSDAEPQVLARKIQVEFPTQAHRFLNLSHGELLEGSSRYGGLQPDYLLNIEDREFQSLKKYAKVLKHRDDYSDAEKIKKIISFIRTELFPFGAYDDKEYLNLLSAFREKRQSIPLSSYLRIGRGVCREHSLILHFALKWMGIENRFLYIRIKETYKNGKVVEEDHAVVALLFNGEIYVVESYADLNYLGFPLKKIIQTGLNYSQFKDPDLAFIQILSINPYPLKLGIPH